MFTGHAEVVKMLIAHKADINIKDYRGKTPLHVASIAGNYPNMLFFSKI